ncbi:S-layer homology domain-containing protein [Paenibacillus agaridevorans]|uniref:S-layer homology domain-containing protein n=1 Tax=Paenibacillus agaridevorans TaxID=171404 RepID=UPI001BE45A48|nr:S-layer homology domain-containing protein [Paenibacillus agaridevorans]
MVGIRYRKQAKMLVAAILVWTMALSGLLQEPQKASAAVAITIDSPENGATVNSGTVRISGTYAGLYDIKLFINGTRQVDALTYDPTGTDSGTWHYDLDTTGYSGMVQLRARGLDTSTRYGIWSPDMHINVSNAASEAPLVTIASPQEGTSLSGVVPIEVEVQSTAGISRVEVRINGGPWQEAGQNNGHYTLNWNTDSLSDRIVSLEARAFNEHGAAGRSLTTYAQIGSGIFETVSVNSQDRAMWIWEAASYNMLLNPGSRNVLLEMAKDTDTFQSEPVKVLYFAVGPFAGMDVMEDRPDLLRDFIAWAHEHGFEVQACIAGGTSPPYMGAYRAFHDVAIGHFEQVLNYNLSSDPTERFVGVNVDIEPYISPDFADVSKFLQVEYLELVEKMIERRDASGLNLSFGPAIPRWYDTSDRAKDITFNGETKWLSEHIQDMVDYISIMNYRDQAEGSVGLIEQAQGEIDYANAIGKPNSVVIGVETLDIANSGDPETITFREEGRAYMESELDKVHAAFGGNPAFGGIAMHHYDSIRWLPSHWGPDGVLWMPSDDSEPPSVVSRQASAQAVDYQTVTLSYGRAYDNSEIENYVIYRSTVPNFTAGAEQAIGTARSLSYKDTGLLPDTTYYYKVAAVDLRGNVGPASEQAVATTRHTELKPMIVSSMKVERSGTAVSAAIAISDYATGVPIAANVEGRFTYAGGRYVSGQTGGSSVSFTSETIGENHLAGFMPRRVTASGYYWAQAYDMPRAANVYPRVRLQSLAVSDGELSEGFAPDQSHYNLQVDAETTSIRITPTAEEAGTAILVNGVPVASGAASPPISLGEEDTIIVVQTTAPNAAMDSYTITVQRSEASVDNVFVAVEDAHVHQNHPSTNYGASEYLNVMDILNADGGGDQLAYLKFDLTGYTQPVQSADVHVYLAETLPKKVKIDVIGYPNSSWNENTIVFNNRPLQTPQALGTMEVQNAGWYSFDIASFVQSRMGTGSDQKVTVRFIINDIPNSSGALVQFHSREHADNQPYVLVNPSSDATLSKLALSSGSLDSPFDPELPAYKAVVSGVDRIAVTPVATNKHAVIEVNGETVLSGTPSQEIPLELGENPAIRIDVTAQDGTEQHYTVEVVRQSAGSDYSGGSVVIPISFADVKVAEGLIQATPHVTFTEKDGNVIGKVDIKEEAVRHALNKAAESNSALRGMTVAVSERESEGQAAGWELQIAPGALARLKTAGLTLELLGPGWSLTIPLEAMAGLAEHKEPLAIHIADLDAAAHEAAISRMSSSPVVRSELGGSEPLWHSDPLVVETNFSGEPIVLTLLPRNAQERLQYTKLEAGLGVYIEHNDGDVAFQRGTLVYDESGQSAGVQIMVDKFSTFTVVALPHKPDAYINGYADGTFRPDNNLARAELAVLLDRLAGTDPKGDTAEGDTQSSALWKDVGSHWAKSAIGRWAAKGLFHGYPDDTFRPDQAVTRAELATILSRWKNLSLPAIPVQLFADTNGHWAQSAIEAGHAAGWWNGYGDDSFRPDQSITRAETIAILNRVTGRIPAAEPIKLPWTDVAPEHPFAGDIAVATATE